MDINHTGEFRLNGRIRPADPATAETLRGLVDAPVRFALQALG
jgi:hypothetical protein